MNIKDLGRGTAAFLGGTAALVAGALAGEAYLRRPRPAAAPEGGRGDAGPGGEGKGAGRAALAGVLPPDRGPDPADPMVDARPDLGAPTRAELPPRMAAATNPVAEHVPTDLLSDEPVTAATRAPDAFRPDPTAVPTAEEREALRPATGPAPSLSADRGDFASGLAQADR